MERREFQIGGWRLRIDPDEVRRQYANALIDWCQCDGCTNWRLTRVRFMPPELQILLASMGLELGDSVSSSHVRLRHTPPPGFTSGRPYYVVPGEIVRAGRNPAVRFGRNGCLSVSCERSRTEQHTREYNLPNLAEPFLYLRVSVLLPWLPGEMREFKAVESCYCRRCGRSKWTEVGRLKSKSRIPDWYGVDLGSRPHDYDVAFCCECGHPTFSFRT